jgi:hypothetical protein
MSMAVLEPAAQELMAMTGGPSFPHVPGPGDARRVLDDGHFVSGRRVYHRDGPRENGREQTRCPARL